MVLEHAANSELVPEESRARIGSLAGVPVADHELLGVLFVATRRPRRFHADDMELLELTADRLAMAMRKANRNDLAHLKALLERAPGV